MNKFFFRKGELDMPTAVVMAGALIAVAVIYAVGKNSVEQPTGKLAKADDNLVGQQGSADYKKAKPVTASDHILGDANAPVKIIEYSDTECPFCKRFHDTMHKLVAANNGKVAWVYRHFPLDSLHSKARGEAQATECAAELGGNKAFWAYLDRIFDVTPSNDGLDPAELLNIAAYIGLDANKFAACVSSGRTAARVQSDYEDGLAAGARGTPYSVVVVKSGPISAIEGAYPYSTVEAAVLSALR